MIENPSSRPLGPQRHDPSVPPQAWPVVEFEKLDDFIAVMGRAPARNWLGALRAELVTEFARPAGAASHAAIHHFCARAGLVGLEALHRACLAFLESRPGQDDVAAAYGRVGDEADRAFVEIDRAITQLG